MNAQPDVGFAIIPLFFGCICSILGLLLTVHWIWMIIDCATNEPSEGNDKLIWLLIIILTGAIGSLIYYFVRRPQRMQLYGR